MNKQLSKDINEIRNFILSFSIAKLEKEIEQKKLLSGFCASSKTLVFASSRIPLDKFIKSKIKGSPGKINDLNDEFFMCIDENTFLRNKLYFEKIMIVSGNCGTQSFNKRVEKIVNLSRQALDLHSPETSLQVIEA